MKNLGVSLRRVAFPAIACMLIFCGCSSSRHTSGNELEIKNWISWNLQLKENTTEEEKSRAIFAIQQYIFAVISKQNFNGTIIKSLQFTITDLGKNRVIISVTARFEMISKNGSPTPSVGPRPPKHELFRQLELPPVLENIDELNQWQGGRF